MEDYNLTKKRRVLIVFHDMIADMVTELFLKGRKLNILLALISQSYFRVPKTISLNAIRSFIMEIPRELQQTASNHLSDIDFKDFMKLYKEYT